MESELSAMSPPPPTSARTVTVSFSDLKDRDRDLSAKIAEGLGPDGLGIISIANVPGYPALRKRLLRLAPRLANLPEDVKKGLEDPDCRYTFGWSHGKQKLEAGRFDTFKGSYYANPILDIPTTDDVLLNRYPSCCRPNIWPADHLPELETAFKALGRLMLEVGLTLAHHCDRYDMVSMNLFGEEVLQQRVQQYGAESLEQTLARSRCHKGRLLYYFPRQFSKQKEVASVSSWCGWHNDYATLTGLACGLFSRNSVEIPCPDEATGLYIRSHDNRVVKAPSYENASNIERSTFALFMLPDWNEKLMVPSGFPYHQELIPSNEALAFGEYSEKLVSMYYPRKT